jgi:acyl-CoA synthetase (AMP-forming)/AMP-acid ligase II
MLTENIVNISRPLIEMAALQPATAAIIFPEKGLTLTFSELDSWSSRLAAGFEKAGITRGVRTALLVPPSPELFAITFALFKAGAIPVFIDPGIGARNMKSCLAEAAPLAFIGIPKAHVARRLLRWGRTTLKIFITVNGGRMWGGCHWKGSKIHPPVISTCRLIPVGTKQQRFFSPAAAPVRPKG